MTSLYLVPDARYQVPCPSAPNILQNDLGKCRCRSMPTNPYQISSSIEIAHHSWSRETEPDGSSHSSHPCRRLPSQSPTWPSTSGEEKKWAQREAFFNKKMPSRGWVRDFQKHMLDQVTFNQHTIGPPLTLAIPKIKQWICILSNKHKVMVFQICKLHPWPSCYSHLQIGVAQGSCQCTKGHQHSCVLGAPIGFPFVTTGDRWRWPPWSQPHPSLSIILLSSCSEAIQNLQDLTNYQWQVFRYASVSKMNSKITKNVQTN